MRPWSIAWPRPCLTWGSPTPSSGSTARCARWAFGRTERWTIAVEAPHAERRSPHSALALEDVAVATSGDERNWVEVQGRRLSHTMDPKRAAPLIASPASVTVVARSCAEADAWATALMVLGPDRGAALARRSGLDVLFLLRNDGGSARGVGVGRLFSEEPAALASAGGR